MIIRTFENIKIFHVLPPAMKAYLFRGVRQLIAEVPFETMFLYKKHQTRFAISDGVKMLTVEYEIPITLFIDDKGRLSDTI